MHSRSSTTSSDSSPRSSNSSDVYADEFKRTVSDGYILPALPPRTVLPPSPLLKHVYEHSEFSVRPAHLNGPRVRKIQRGSTHTSIPMGSRLRDGANPEFGIRIQIPGTEMTSPRQTPQSTATTRPSSSHSVASSIDSPVTATMGGQRGGKKLAPWISTSSGFSAGERRVGGGMMVRRPDGAEVRRVGV